VSEPLVTYEPRPDTKPESERATLAAVYRFIIDCHATRRPPKSRPSDGTKVKEDSANERIIQ
jgi:hypothetical protein